MDLPATKQPSTNLWGSWRIISRSLHVPGSPSSAFTTRYFGLQKKITSYENEYPFLAWKKISFRQFPQNKVEGRNQIHLTTIQIYHNDINKYRVQIHPPRSPEDSNLWMLIHAPFFVQYKRAENIYEVCSKSIQIGIVVVVHWVGCVCNQSWHVRTCLSNSWHKLQVTVFAQLAAVGRGSNMCIYVMVIFTMCESTEQWICSKFCFKIRKTATETYQLSQQAYGEDAMGHTQVFDWFRWFKDGRTSVQSDPRSRRPSKVMLLAFFYSEGIVHQEYAPDGQTINKEFYLEVLRRLHESVRQKRPEKWWDGDWILHHTMCPHTLHILCSSFWPNTALLSRSSRHTHQISHRVTFSYSQGLGKFWKDTDLRQRRTSNEIRRRHY